MLKFSLHYIEFLEINYVLINRVIFIFFFLIFFASCSKIDNGFSEPTFIYDGYPLNVPEEENILYFTIIPYKNFIELSYDYRLLFEYLTEKIGKRIVYLPLDEYYKVYFMLSARKVDLAIIDPYIFFKKKLNENYKIILKPKYKDLSLNHSVIVARNDKQVKNLDENIIKKISISFDNLESFLGYYVPIQYLENHNLYIKNFKKIYLASNFENTVQGVLSGNFDLGCIDYLTYNKYKTKGIGLKIIYQSKGYEHFPIVINQQLDDKLQEKIRNVFLQLNVENYQELLNSINENLIGYTIATINEYKNFE